MMMHLATGVVLGLSAGLAPGPMLTFVLAQTLRYGFRAGASAACAPLVTDLPIVAASLLLISRMSGSNLALGIISLAGAVFLVFLGYETVTVKGVPEASAGAGAQSLRDGVITNFLNPHPYLFWTTVGAPMILRAWTEGGGRAAAFIAGFYLCLVGSKVILAWLTDRGRSLLAGTAYLFCMRALGVLLWACALLLASDGIGFLRA
jgi:threonine/homoserine/homoserine lactone efflux protein